MMVPMKCEEELLNYELFHAETSWVDENMIIKEGWWY